MRVLQALGTDEWTRLGSETFMPLRITTENAPLRGSITALTLSGVRLSQIRCTGAIVARTPGLAANDGCDDVLLNLQLSGTGTVVQGDRQIVLAPGQATICEADRPYELRYGAPLNMLTLQVPREHIAPHDRRVRAANARLLSARSPGLVVLRHFLTGVLKAGDAAAGDTGTLAETAVTLLTSSLGILDDSLPDADARLTRIRAFIDLRACDPDITMDDVARAHHMSRRHMEILFARQGDSPAAYLRGLRLRRAAALLRRDGPETTTAGIAYAVGFRDVTTFIRAFRRVHGCTPGEWRSTGRRATEQ